MSAPLLIMVSVDVGTNLTTKFIRRMVEVTCTLVFLTTVFIVQRTESVARLYRGL